MEDLDRLSTTSAMSESSVSHRLNDVQDVQDIARMQEESKFIFFFGSHQCGPQYSCSKLDYIKSSTNGSWDHLHS